MINNLEMKKINFYLAMLILFLLVSCSKENQVVSESELYERWNVSEDVQDYIYWARQNVENTLMLSQKFGVKVQDISKYRGKCDAHNNSISNETICDQIKKYENARNNLVKSRVHLKQSNKELEKYRDSWVKYVASKMPSPEQLLIIKKEGQNNR